MRRWLVCALLLGCSGPATGPEVDVSMDVDAGRDLGDDATDASTVCELDVTPAAEDVQEIRLEAEDCTVAISLSAPTIVEVIALDAILVDTDEPRWIAPHVADSLIVQTSGRGSLTVFTHGVPVDDIVRERSLVWTAPEIVDAPDVVGLERLLRVATPGDPGLLLADWLRRFGTTAHSERLGPQQLLEEIEETHGVDPMSWDIDALDFVVTGVHNRIDLADDSACGELRVSVASTHPLYQPFHAIFLFEQPATERDVSPDGRVHCGSTQRKWARLSSMDDAAFLAEAGEIIAGGLQPENFLMVETVEFIVSPWEWRQWLPEDNPNPTPELPRVFDNPPLFQTVDTSRLNADGALRDEFLQFVADNAAALDARELLLPQQFRPRSARVNAGVPWVPLRLDGIDSAVLDQFPTLRQNIEIVGCPACHATDADFIQTRPDRTFSPFYDKELDARAEYLDAAQRGAVPAVPFGPLQDAPVLPP